MGEFWLVMGTVGAPTSAETVERLSRVNLDIPGCIGLMALFATRDEAEAWAATFPVKPEVVRVFGQPLPGEMA